MKRYFDDLIARTGTLWDQYWFAPPEVDLLARVRPLACALAGVWFLIAMADLNWWYGAAGWSASDFARQLSTAAEGSWAGRFHISPLWSTSQPIVFQIWAGSGLVLALLAALGIGGRAVVLALWVAVLFLAQRMTWTTAALEPFLIAMLGYLVIDPGRSLVSRASAPAQSHWTLTLATRLIQFHVWLLVAAALASQLSSLPWWRGDAFWWLAVTGHSQVLAPETLRGHILLINALTHAMVICTGIAVVTLWSPRLRPIGVVCGCVLGAAYALLGDQTLYGLLLMTGLLSYWSVPDREMRKS